MQNDSFDLKNRLAIYDSQVNSFDRSCQDVDTIQPKSSAKELTAKVQSLMIAGQALGADFKKCVREIKTELKFSTDSHQTGELKEKLEKIATSYKARVEQMHRLYVQLKAHNPRIKGLKKLHTQITNNEQNMISAEKIIKLSETKVTILEAKKKLHGPEKIPSFQKVCAKLAASDMPVASQEINFIASCLQFKNYRISESCITRLQNYITLINTAKKLSNEEKIQLISWCQGVCKDYTEADKRVKAQLGSLEEDLKTASTPHAKAEIYIQYTQIQANPIEFPIELEKKNKFEELILAPGVKEALQDSRLVATAKVKGLCRIRNSFPASDVPSKQTLISGAGPGGLMFGLMQATKGQAFMILEARAKEKAVTRQNILSLGKEDSTSQLEMFQAYSKDKKAADIQLLDFFGITDLLVADKKAHPTADGVFDAKIGDLQEALMTQIKKVRNNSCYAAKS